MGTLANSENTDEIHHKLGLKKHMYQYVWENPTKYKGWLSTHSIWVFLKGGQADVVHLVPAKRTKH